MREQQRDRIDRQQRQERRHQQQCGQRDRGVVVVFLETDRDQQRRDLGLVRQIAGDEDHRSVFAQPAREGQRESGQQSGQDLRKDHPAQRGQTRGSERRRRFFLFAPEGFQQRLHGAHRERQADEDQRQHDAGRGVGDLQSMRFEPLPDPAVGRIDRGQRDARDRGGQRERQIDQRVEQAPPREAITHQHPGDQRADDRRADRRDERRTEAQLQRSLHPRIAQRAPPAVHAQSHRAHAQRQQRQHHHQTQPRQAQPQTQAEARQRIAAARASGRGWRSCGAGGAHRPGGHWPGL